MKDLKKLGKTLTRSEQRHIEGGKFICCYSNPNCPSYHETSCIIIAGVCHYYPGEGTAC